MKFEAHPPEHSSSIRKIDVIVLTDNRDQSNSDRLFYDYRCSAFKETDIDPLEEHVNDMQFILTNQNVQNLIKRVSHLEQKVRELQHIEEGLQSDPEGSNEKKRRRKFEDMQRSIECLNCHRFYGSETALKYHQKLKHSKTEMQRYNNH